MKLKLSVAIAASAFALPLMHANSPSMVEVGKTYVTPSISVQSFDEFYAGSSRGGNPPGGQDIERQNYRIYLDHGLSPAWALDLSLGYFKTESGVGGPFTAGSQDGIADTYVGVRRALATQAAQGFDAALRVGFTIPGDYQTGQLSAPGDDAYGADLRLFVGRTFGMTRLEGMLGYAFNEGAVPESIGFGLKVTQQVASNIWLEAGYRYFDADGDLNIGGPGFTPARLPQVSEQGQVVEVAAAFADAGGRYYRVFVSQLVDGKNIGREQTIGASISFRY